jgi:hypothetical protein
MFINPNATVPVEDGNGNVINIKAKLTFADYGLIEDSLLRLNVKTGQGNKKNGQAGEADEVNIDMHVTQSAKRIAVLQQVVKSWSGPAFLDEQGKQIRCTRANIALLDPTEDLVIKVLDTIDELNESPTDAPAAREDVADPNPIEQPS